MRWESSRTGQDWGNAPDFGEAMWRILQQNKPDYFEIDTGEAHSVREFAEKVFQKLELDYKQYVATDSKYFRPTEVDALHGDSTKAREKLGWVPKVSFDQLIDIMIEADMELAQKEKALIRAGYGRSNNRL